MACQALNLVGGLEVVCKILYHLVEQLNKVNRQKFDTEQQLEHELRITLNTLLNFLVYNNEDDTVAHEFTRGQFVCIEEICMRAVKISLELAIVPIRKFLIIFFIYMRLLFGRDTRAPIKEIKANKQPQRESENIKKNKHFLYLKEY